MVVVEATSLSKRFGSFAAVDDVSLTIRRGECYGFLGPNGAGKTTTLKMLLGLLAPTSGGAFLFGMPVSGDNLALRQRVGVALEQAAFYEEMTGWEYLDFFARLYHVADARKRIGQLLERLSLLEFGHVVVSAYSTGMRRKLNLARALVHQPELLVLDEPASGLDPHGIKDLRTLLQEELARGATILISSHILSEVEKIADRVGILAHGHMIAEDKLEYLRAGAQATRRMRIELAGVPTVVSNAVVALESLTAVTSVLRSGQVLLVNAEDSPDCRLGVSRAITAAGATIIEMQTLQLSLEETFLTLTEAHVTTLFGESGPHATSGAEGQNRAAA